MLISRNIGMFYLKQNQNKVALAFFC